MREFIVFFLFSFPIYKYHCCRVRSEKEFDLLQLTTTIHSLFLGMNCKYQDNQIRVKVASCYVRVHCFLGQRNRNELPIQRIQWLHLRYAFFTIFFHYFNHLAIDERILCIRYHFFSLRTYNSVKVLQKLHSTHSQNDIRTQKKQR